MQKKKIGILEFGGAVVYVYETATRNGLLEWGSFHYEEREIHIASGLDRDFFRQVLCHEVAHAALRLLGECHANTREDALYFEEVACECVSIGVSVNWDEIDRMAKTKKPRAV